MKVYYAHCMDIYYTEEERNDVIHLGQAGFEVINPSDKIWKPHWESKGMDFAKELIEVCDVVIFKRIPDGRISGGVDVEIEMAKELGIPVLEYQSDCSNTMTRTETKEYIRHSRNKDWYNKRETGKH